MKDIPRIAEISIKREPYLGNLYAVDYHYDDGDAVQVRGFLRTSQGILEFLRTFPAYAVHFVGGGRPTKTYELRRRG